MPDPLVYFCGVFPGTGTGHFCHPHKGPTTPWGRAGDYPLFDWHPDRDGRCCAERVTDHYARSRENDRRRAMGLPVEPEGEFVHVIVGGWTLIAAWDRSEDRRGGCTTSFAIQGEHDPDAALQFARAAAPRVFGRIEAHIGRAVTVRPWRPHA